MSELLKIERLSCGYGDRPVLSEVSLEVQSGESVLIAGPNGCGKSTLLKAIAGFLPLTGGEIVFDGKALAQLKTEERVRFGIGYLRQTDNVFPGATVDENLMLAGLTLPKAVYEKSRKEMLEIFDFLVPKLSTRAGALSGGQRQALALAMVFLRPQKLYLLDEPTAGLSPKAAKEIIEKVRALAAKSSAPAILIVEHRLELMGWVNKRHLLGVKS